MFIPIIMKVGQQPVAVPCSIQLKYCTKLLGPHNNPKDER